MTKENLKLTKAKVRPAARVMAGLREALAHAKGEASKVVVHAPEAIHAPLAENHRQRTKGRTTRAGGGVSES
jgi:hypothetical protein